MDVLDDAGPTTATPTARSCDGKDCGARAYVYADINGTELAYCGHHGTAYLPALKARGTVIIDLRDTI